MTEKCIRVAKRIQESLENLRENPYHLARAKQC